MKPAKFPFTGIGKTYLGTIYRPYALIEISSPRIADWIQVEVVVDTGADYTLLPRKYADLLGINVNIDCLPDKTLGVGGSETIYLCKKLVKIRIGTWNKTIPVGILGRDDIPFLLGRLDCLEAFRLIFDKRTTFFS